MSIEHLAFDPHHLAAWLAPHIGERPGSVEIVEIKGGASNLTFRVTSGDRAFALRHPTETRNDATANTFVREARLLAALAGSDIPHARLIGADVGGNILGVPFILTEWIDGFSPKAPLAAAFRTLQGAQALAWELTDALAKIGNTDYRALGLEGFGKPEGFLERQVDRWKSQLDRAHCRDLDGVDALCAALTQLCPTSQRTAIIHGDYQFINVLFAHTMPPRLAAVIDWETATIGDPLLDLGWMLAGWQEPGEPVAHAAYMDWTAMPTRAAVAKRYAAATGLDVSRVDYYTALALFKLAAIMEGWYSQFLRGRSNVAEHAHMETMVPQMIDRALRFLGAR